MPKHPIIVFIVFIFLLFTLSERTHAEDKTTEEIDVLMEVDVDRIIDHIADQIVKVLKQASRKEIISFSLLKEVPDGATIHLENIADKDKVIEIIRNFDDRLEIVSSENNKIIKVQITEKSKRQITEHAVRQTIDIIRSRANRLNIHKLAVQRLSPDGILIGLAGIEDPNNLRHLISRRLSFKFHMVDKTARKTFRNIFLPMVDDRSQTIVISKRAIMQSDQITDIQPSLQKGMPVVVFSLSSLGAKHFCDLTKKNLGKSFAIVLDDQIIETSQIETTACDGKGVITGNLSKEEATDLAVFLSAFRALPEFTIKEGFTSKILNEARQQIR